MGSAEFQNTAGEVLLHSALSGVLSQPPSRRGHLIMKRKTLVGRGQDMGVTDPAGGRGGPAVAPKAGQLKRSSWKLAGREGRVLNYNLYG